MSRQFLCDIQDEIKKWFFSNKDKFEKNDLVEEGTFEYEYRFGKINKECFQILKTHYEPFLRKTLVDKTFTKNFCRKTVDANGENFIKKNKIYSHKFWQKTPGVILSFNISEEKPIEPVIFHNIDEKQVHYRERERYEYKFKSCSLHLTQIKNFPDMFEVELEVHGSIENFMSDEVLDIIEKILKVCNGNCFCVNNHKNILEKIAKKFPRVKYKKPESLCSGNVNKCFPCRVTFKPDGYRSQIFVDFEENERGIYLLKDSGIIGQKNIGFVGVPFKEFVGDPTCSCILLDGELVYFEDTQEYKFFVSDFYSDGSKKIRFLDYEKLFLKVEKKIKICNKQEFFIENLEGLKCIIDSYLVLSREGGCSDKCDGIIMKTIGKGGKVVKWKPSSLNSVDFLVGEEGELYSNAGNREELCKEVGKVSKEFSGMVVECTFPENKNFMKPKVIRVRNDKHTGNYVSVRDNILKCIEEGDSKIFEAGKFKWKNDLCGPKQVYVLPRLVSKELWKVFEENIFTRHNVSVFLVDENESKSQIILKKSLVDNKILACINFEEGYIYSGVFNENSIFRFDTDKKRDIDVVKNLESHMRFVEEKEKEKSLLIRTFKRSFKDIVEKSGPCVSDILLLNDEERMLHTFEQRNILEKSLRVLESNQGNQGKKRGKGLDVFKEEMKYKFVEDAKRIGYVLVIKDMSSSEEFQEFLVNNDLREINDFYEEAEAEAEAEERGEEEIEKLHSFLETKLRLFD